jgi:selenide,water dikinase
VDETTRTILFDPQTAGGLLVSISAAKADPFVRALQGRGGDATIVGDVLPRTDPLILVV